MKLRRSKKLMTQRKSMVLNNKTVTGQASLDPVCFCGCPENDDRDNRWRNILGAVAFVGLMFTFAAWLCWN